jgi:ATP-binding cassette subfamily B protein
MVDRMQRLGIRAPILLLGGMIVTMVIEPVLTLVLVGILPLLGLVIWYVSRKGIPMYTQAQSSLDKLVNKVQENMTGVRVIKALSKSENERERFDEANLELARKEQRAGMLMALSNPAMNLFLNIGLTLSLSSERTALTADLTDRKDYRFSELLHDHPERSKYGDRACSSLYKGRGKREADRRGARSAGGHDNGETRPYAWGLSYRILRTSAFPTIKIRDNLSNISFGIRRGETMGIIGPTGSGKSTIINLLLRFYDPDSGEIRISGDKLSGIPPEELHGKFVRRFPERFSV